MRFIYLILILSFFQACNQKTDLELLVEYGSHLNEIEAFEYNFKHLTEYSYTDQPNLREGTAYFEKNPKDTLIGYNYYFYIERAPYRFVSIYGGDKSIGLRMNDSVAYLRDLLKYPFNKRFNQPVFHESILSIGKWTSGDSLKYNIINLAAKDTLISGQKCKVFAFETIGAYYNWWFNKSWGKGKMEVKIAFTTKTKVPVYMRTKMYMQDPDYAERKVWFSNLEKKKYPPEKLSIESVPSYYRWGLEQKKLAINTIAPNFNLPDSNGDFFELSSLKGKYVLLQFGFIGCGPCALSIPHLNQIQDKYEAKGLEVVGVNLYCKSQEKVKTYEERHNIKYKFLWSDNDYIAEQYQITSAPTLYLIDRKGIIEYSQNGYDEEKLLLLLKTLFGT